MEILTQENVDQLRAAAEEARGRASGARELALAITVRRAAVVGRADACLARHTPDVWSSKAAIESRTELQRSVAWALWLAGEGLSDTRLALGARAAEFDESARSYRRQADEAAARLAAQDLGGPPIDLTWLEGVR